MNNKEIGGRKRKQKEISERELNILKIKYDKIRKERKREKKEGYDLTKFELEYI